MRATIMGRWFNPEDIKVFEQMLVLLEEMKYLTKQLQAAYKIFKQTLKESFEEVAEEDVEPRNWKGRMQEMEKSEGKPLQVQQIVAEAHPKEISFQIVL